MKKARKILVAMMAMVMLLGTCMTVNAEGTNGPIAAVKSISAKSTTVYTNGDAEVTVSYTWDKKKGTVDQRDPSTNGIALKADSNNKGVVKVDSIVLKGEPQLSKNGKVATTTATLKLKAVANGKAKVTITDSTGKKKKAITVTVKTYAESIAFDKNVVSEKDGNYTVTIANAKNAKVNLGAYITNSNASNKSIAYKAETGKGISVDSKGNVKVTKNGASVADITVTAKGAKGELKETVKVVFAGEEAFADKVTIVADTQSKSDATPGILNAKYTLNMKGNKTSNAYTYQLNWKDSKKVKAEALSFVSSKPSVASVDANGKITAKGNGTAKITVTPKYNSAKSTSITVKVTTDVENISIADEKFTVIANGKAAANINAKTNANASNKSVTYKLVSVQPADGSAPVTTKGAMNKYASVSTKGVVKMKKAATATVVVSAKADAKVARTVTVTGVVPVNGVALKVGDAKANNSYTVYRTAAGEQMVLDIKAEPTNSDASDPTMNWSSNKTAVAEVRDGKVYAKANGTAVITATAADGSGKKASVKVTVKTDAYEINIAKDTDRDEKVYVDGAGNYTLSTVLAASTNADASNKKLTYTVSGNAVKKVKLDKDGDEVSVVVIANDKRQKTAGTAVSKTVKLIATDKAASAVTLAIVNQEELLTVGATYAPEFSVTAKNADEIVVDPTAVKLATATKADAKIVSVKNGVITAKKEGVANLTAKYGDEEIKFTVYVGRNTAAIEKELEKIATDKLKAENYDYLGVKTKFDAKKNAFTLDIINPTNDMNNIEGTGLVAFAKGVYAEKKATLGCNSVEITSDGITWIAENNMDGFGSAYRVENDEKVEVLAHVGQQEAVEYVLDQVIGDATQLKDWNGKECEVVFNFTDTREVAGNKTFEHTVKYTAISKMDSKLYEGVVDTAMDNAIQDVEGLTLDYVPENNSVDIVVVNGNKTIDETVAASRDAIVDALEVVFVDAEKVNLNVKAKADEKFDGTKTENKVNNGQTRELINAMLDSYVAQLSDRGLVTLADLNGVVMSADVTFAVGAQKYTYTYTANVVLSESVFDETADKTIKDAIDANAEALKGVGVSASYADGNNELSFEFVADAADKSLVEFMDLKSILKAIIGDSNAVSTVVVTDKASTPITLTSDVDADANKILVALAAGAEKVAELDGDVATIKVVYASANGASQKTLAYTVAFEVEEKAPETTVNAVAEETTEEVVTEETTEETVEETAEETVEESTEEVVTEETIEETVEEVVTTEDVA